MTTNNVARTLDRSNPAAARAKLGSTLDDLIAARRHWQRQGRGAQAESSIDEGAVAKVRDELGPVKFFQSTPICSRAEFSMLRNLQRTWIWVPF